MKSYHLADALTLGEVIAGVILLGMTALRISADYAIWVFVAGELCDAFDGVCARRWPYPNDGKTRWWRTYVTQIEHLSDIFIAVVCMIYLIRSTNEAVATGAFTLGIIIIAICSCIEVVRSLPESSNSSSATKKLINNLILIRRWIYAFAGIGGGVFLLIMATSWHTITKLSAIAIGISIGIALLIYKQDRALEP